MDVPLCQFYVMLGIEPRTLCMAKAKQALYYLQPQSDSPILWEHSCLATFFLTHISDSLADTHWLHCGWAFLPWWFLNYGHFPPNQITPVLPWTALGYSSLKIHPLWIEILLVRDDGTKTGDPGQKDIILHNRTKEENWEMSGDWTMGRYRNPTSWSSPFLGQIRLY